MHRICFITLSLFLAGSAAQAKTSSAHLKWMAGPPGLPSGATFAVVSGDPGKAGAFKVRIKMPANYTVAPHHHPTDEHLTILSGKLAFGMGDKVNRAKAKWMAAGAGGTAKAKMNHYVFTKGPATVQVAGMGPFEITYADPRDDPRK